MRRAPSSSCSRPRCWSRWTGRPNPASTALAKQIAAQRPYLPLITVDPTTSLPDNAIPFSQTGGNFDRLTARLRAACGFARLISP